MNGTIPAPKATDAQRLDGKPANAYRKTSDVIDIPHGGTGTTTLTGIRQLLGRYTDPSQVGVTDNNIVSIYNAMDNGSMMTIDGRGLVTNESNKLPANGYGMVIIFRHNVGRIAIFFILTSGSPVGCDAVIYTPEISGGKIVRWHKLTTTPV